LRGGDKSTDFSGELNLGNETAGKSMSANLDDKSIGVATAKLHSIPIAHDLCSTLDLDACFFISPWWQLGMPAMSSLWSELMTDCDAHKVTQFAANAGLVAMASINVTEIKRMYLNINSL
jgi:hypothetical protein